MEQFFKDHGEWIRWGISALISLLITVVVNIIYYDRKRKHDRIFQIEDSKHKKLIVDKALCHFQIIIDLFNINDNFMTSCTSGNDNRRGLMEFYNMTDEASKVFLKESYPLLYLYSPEMAEKIKSRIIEDCELINDCYAVAYQNNNKQYETLKNIEKKLNNLRDFMRAEIFDKPFEGLMEMK